MAEDSILIIVALVVSFLSFIISFLTFWRNRRSKKLKILQDSQVLILASQAVVLWEQIQTLITANVNSYSLNSYVFESLRNNALRFENSIQKAVELGLWTRIIGNTHKDTLYYTGFIQSLIYSATTSKNDINDWLSQHLVMGMIRMLDACEKYGISTVNEIINTVKIDESIKIKAREYLDQ